MLDSLTPHSKILTDNPLITTIVQTKNLSSNAVIQQPLSVLPTEFYAPYFSEQSKSRPPNSIRSLIEIAMRPGMLPLFAGVPSPETFPITSLVMSVRSPEDPKIETPLTINGPALREALQYTATRGISRLLRWLEGLQEVAHGRRLGEGWGVSIGSGSQDLLYKAFLAVLNPGDAVLVEAPAYSGVLPILQGLNCDITEVETDSQGIVSDSMEKILNSWPENKPKPKLLYTVPYGCNPTGMTATLERRLHVLRLARRHGILIFEDDPYHYLYFGHAPRPPSYFRLDAEQKDYPAGIVTRFDSFSKVLSAGLRLGFVSGPHAIMDAIDLHTSSANLQPSSLSQVVAFTLLDNWGYKGFFAHTKMISEIYRQKRDVFEAAMKRHLDGLVEWATPEAGMFVWFKLLLPPLADGSERDCGDILQRAIEKGVVALPGSSFYALPRNSAYVRASFSILQEAQTDEALRLLAETLREALNAL